MSNVCDVKCDVLGLFFFFFVLGLFIAPSAFRTIRVDGESKSICETAMEADCTLTRLSG